MTTYRKWLFGGIAATILLFVVGFMLLVNPARNQAAEIQAQAESVEQNNIMLANKLTQLEQQSAEVPAKLDEIAQIEQKMPSDMKQPELVRAIEGQASSAGVDLTSIAPGTPVALEGSPTDTVALPMAITAAGRYANVKTFVDNLENLDRAFLIRTINVTSADDSLDSFTVSIEGDFFSLPEGTLQTPEKKTSETPAPATATTPAPAASAAAKTSKAADDQKQASKADDKQKSKKADEKSKKDRNNNNENGKNKN